MPRMPKTARKTFSLKDTELKTWFERDRAHVDLQDRETGRTLIEFWDEDVEQLLEDGFLDRRDLHGSLYRYAIHLGVIKAPKMTPGGRGHSTIRLPPLSSARMRASMGHHAKKASPAQLNRDIVEVLALKDKRQHSTISDDSKIRDAIARFPPMFGLRGFPGDVFRLSPTSSYVSGGHVMLYTQRKDGDHWSDFSKGTEPELRGEIVSLASTGGRTTRSHSTRALKKSYRVSALVGAGRALPVDLGTVSRKSSAMKTARAFMKANPPKSEYDSVQILPLVNGRRDWNTESIRWLGVTTNVRRPAWVRGQGIK